MNPEQYQLPLPDAAKPPRRAPLGKLALRSLPRLLQRACWIAELGRDNARRMKRRGLIEFRHQADGRRKLVVLTPTGQQIAKDHVFKPQP